VTKLRRYRQLVNAAELRRISGKSATYKKAISAVSQCLQSVMKLRSVALVESGIKDSGGRVETYDKTAAREQLRFFREQCTLGHGHIVTVELAKACLQIGL
jgi:hypothetical protein